MCKIARIDRMSRRKCRVMAKVMSSDEYSGYEPGSRVELIQALIPLGLMKVQEELEAEVRSLVGERYSRGPVVRHGLNPGSVVLGGQRVGIRVPRVRDRIRGMEVPLMSYQQFHRGAAVDDAALVRVLKGLSCRDYESAAMAAPEAFGLSSSTISLQLLITY